MKRCRLDSKLLGIHTLNSMAQKTAQALTEYSTVVATPETPMTGATPNPPGIPSGLPREAPPRIAQRGYRNHV